MPTQEQKRIYSKKYRDTHKAKRALYFHLWLVKNREARNAQKKQYREQNKEKIAIHDKWYRQNHREKRLAWTVKYQTLKKNAVGSHTPEEWNELKKQFGNQCLCCHKTEPEVKLTKDHVVSVSIGGTNNADNLQLLCSSCNSSKKSKIIDYRPQALSNVS